MKLLTRLCSSRRAELSHHTRHPGCPLAAGSRVARVQLCCKSWVGAACTVVALGGIGLHRMTWAALQVEGFRHRSAVAPTGYLASPLHCGFVDVELAAWLNEATGIALLGLGCGLAAVWGRRKLPRGR